MDRSLKKAPLGLHLLWLSDKDSDTKEMHDLDKVIMSMGKQKERGDAKDQFVLAIGAQDGLAKRIWEKQVELHGRADEPNTVPL